jgi:hypothetical protein
MLISSQASFSWKQISGSAIQPISQSFKFANSDFYLLTPLGGVWSTSSPYRFTPEERAHSTHPIGGWVRPRACLDAVKRQIPTLARNRTPEPRSSSQQPVAIPTELPPAISDTPALELMPSLVAILPVVLVTMTTASQLCISVYVKSGIISSLANSSLSAVKHYQYACYIWNLILFQHIQTDVKSKKKQQLH